MAHGMDDLFGHVPQEGELAPPESGGARSSGVIIGGIHFHTPPEGHTPETIRERIHRILAFVRAADTMPWDARDLRYHTGSFPYMAEWLKDGEGDRLMAEFKAEMDWLDAPPGQVAPNWRKIWKIAA
jgi:hypothetical protein